MSDAAVSPPLTAPLSSLRPDPFNPRRARSPAAIKAMAATIGDKGERLRAPLIVRSDGKGGWLVADGETRRLALEERVKAKAIPADHPVRIEIIDARGEADVREAALALNFMRFDLHPVEAFEAVAACDAAGMTTKEIAARFGVTEKEINQRRALGQLAPAIRDAWLKGEIGEDEAQAFTLSADQEQQQKVFTTLKKARCLREWKIREALAGDSQAARKFLKMVGAKAYEAAGGRLIRDLFANSPDDAAGVSDFGLLQRLAGEAVDKKIEGLKAEGYAWAEEREKHPNLYNYKKIAAKSKADKAKCGAVVSVDHDGSIRVDRGYILPSGKKTAKKKAGAEGGTKALPFALVRALSVARTKALQRAVAADADLALRLLVATLDWRATAPMRETGSPSTLTHGGYVDIEARCRERGFFEACFTATAGLSRADLLEAAAAHVARSINMERTVPYNPATDGAAVIDACDEIAINRALEEAFDAGGYFAKAGKAAALAALADCNPSLDAAALAAFARKKTPELAAIAADYAKAKGWLPKELRYARYCGPAAPEAAPPKRKGPEPVPKPKHATKQRRVRKAARRG